MGNASHIHGRADEVTVLILLIVWLCIYRSWKKVGSILNSLTGVLPIKDMVAHFVSGGVISLGDVNRVIGCGCQMDVLWF